MSNRMGRVFSASRYAGALDAYIDYLKNMDRRGTRVGQGKARPVSIKLYIDPFGIKLGSGVILQVSASEPSWTALSAAIGTRTKEAPGTGNTALKIKGYRPPRIILKTGINPTGTPKTSARTKMKYLDYKGQSFSAPFGKKADTDVISTEFTTIQGLLMPAGTGKDRRVYLSPEFV